MRYGMHWYLFQIPRYSEVTFWAMFPILLLIGHFLLIFLDFSNLSALFFRKSIWQAFDQCYHLYFIFMYPARNQSWMSLIFYDFSELPNADLFHLLILQCKCWVLNSFNPSLLESFLQVCKGYLVRIGEPCLIQPQSYLEIKDFKTNVILKY